MTDKRATDALDLMREKVEEAEALVRERKRAANVMASALGLDVPYESVEHEAASVGTRLRVKPDEFASFTTPSAAAHRLLEIRGKERGATTLDDAFETLTAGGYRFDTRDPEQGKAGLRIALGKDVRFHRLANGYYGLATWYGVKPSKTAKRGKGVAPDEATTAEASPENGNEPH